MSVQKDGLAIKYIENPSEKVQKAVLQQNSHAIQYIKK